MSTTQTQEASGFQQLALLRKVLIRKDTGALTYISQSGHRGRIAITMGDIIGGDYAVKELASFFSEPVEHCNWITRNLESVDNWAEPALAISKAINGISWNNTVVMKLKSLFIKLPPVHIRMIPLHRYEYNDGLTYLMLYQQSVKEENFLLAHFLNESADGAILKRRVKVLVLGYCLGLITAMPPQSSVRSRKNSIAGIASRVLNRIRGL